MNRIILDFRGIQSLYELHEYLRTAFNLPDAYGRNMDALWDCLYCSFEEPTTIVLRNITEMPKEMSGAITTLRDLFLDLDLQDRHVAVRFEADEPTVDLEDFMI